MQLFDYPIFFLQSKSCFYRSFLEKEGFFFVCFSDIGFKFSLKLGSIHFSGTSQDATQSVVGLEVCVAHSIPYKPVGSEYSLYLLQS